MAFSTLSTKQNHVRFNLKLFEFVASPGTDNAVSNYDKLVSDFLMFLFEVNNSLSVHRIQ